MFELLDLAFEFGNASVLHRDQGLSFRELLLEPLVFAFLGLNLIQPSGDLSDPSRELPHNQQLPIDRRGARRDSRAVIHDSRLLTHPTQSSLDHSGQTRLRRIFKSLLPDL